MIEKWTYFIPLLLLIFLITIYILIDRITEYRLFYLSDLYRRTCKSCGVSQVLIQEDGFMFWKKTAKSSCKCDRYISYFIK